MTRLRSTLALAVVLVTALATLPAAAAVTAAADPTTAGSVPIMIVVDTSGSMNEKAGDGNTTKLQDAQRAVLDLVGILSPKQQMGLMTYPGGSTVDGCTEGNVRIAIGRPDAVAASATVRKLVADGGTPTSAALRHAARELGEGPGVIVLVSDGSANCGPPVCETAKKIRDSGIEIKVNTVGFDIERDSDVASELRCVADATGGTYALAGDADALRTALREAAASNIEIDARIPATMSAAVGRSATSGTVVQVGVTNTGQVQADDVRISLDFLDDKDRGGALLVSRPVLFLGNLAPGATRDISFEVRPDDSTIGKTYSWIVTATTADGAGNAATGKTAVTSGIADGLGIIPSKGIVAIVGDSYSSGEGAGSYLEGTRRDAYYSTGCPKPAATPTALIPSGLQATPRPCIKVGNACHRSNLTYGGVLVGDRARIIACSGAVTGDFYGNQNSAGQKMTPQLQALRTLALSKDSPSAVMLTIGGNDVGFGDMIKTCFFSSNCWTEPTAGSISTSVAGWKWTGDGQRKIDRVPDVGNDLMRIYRDIDRAVNDADARKKRGGKVAPIIVLPYVRGIPETGTGVDGCFAGISAGEIDLLNDFVNVLNSTIATATRTVRKERRPVYYAPDVISAFQPDHTMCDGDSNLVTRKAGTFKEGVADVAINHDQQLVHPTANGYRAIAVALAGWARGTQVLPAGGTPSWNSVTTKKTGFFGKTSAWVTGKTPTEIYEAGGDYTIDEDGYAPSSTVVFRLESVPRVLGSAIADENGRVRATLTLPSDVERGRHHVRAIGTDPSGAAHETVAALTVLPTGTAWAVLLLLVGLAMTFVAARRLRGAKRQIAG